MHQYYQTHSACVLIGAVEGIGVITARAVVVTTAAEARQYESGRHFSTRKTDHSVACLAP